MFITADLLKEKGACQEGVRFFNKIFPDGCELNSENILKIKHAPSDFVWWFYNNIQQDKRLYTLCAVGRSNAVNRSDAVNRSNAVYLSDAVSRSDAVYGSNAVSRSFGIFNCKGISNSAFCTNVSGGCLLFNKQVDAEKMKQLFSNMHFLLDGWLPEFTNIKTLYLQNGSDWKKTPIANAVELSRAKAWAGMPQEAIDYVKSLPEFDADIFYEITGIK